MEIFAVLTGETFDAFMRKVSRELIQFDNCLILERRMKVKDLQDMGITLPLRGIGPLSKKGPVVSYEIIPIDSIRYKRDNNGNVTMWQQYNNSGQTKDFSPEEVILIKNDEESGDILAFPALQMVLPDTRILRQLETDASLAGHRLAFPIFMYKVGDPRYEGTLPKKESDLDGIWNTLEGMLLDGALIIPGADTFEVVLSDVKLDGLTAVLSYFKERVISGMGMFDYSGANRSIADRLDVQLYDEVKTYQKTLQEVFTLFVYSKWLMEGGYNLKYGSIGLAPERVTLEFKEIDTDSMIQRENHALALWVQDAITHDEIRERLGLTPLAEEGRKLLYSAMIGEITNSLAKDLASHQAAITPKPVVAGPSKSAAQATGGGQNQKTNAKTRAKKTSTLEDEQDVELVDDDYNSDDLSDAFALLSVIRESQQDAIDSYGINTVNQSWDKLELEISDYVSRMIPAFSNSFSASDMEYLKMLFKEEIETSLRNSIVLALREGLDRGFEEARAINPDVAPMRTTMFNRHVQTILNSLTFYVDKLVNDLFARIEKEVGEADEPSIGVEDAFMALHYRLEQIVTSHTASASNWGVCMVAEHAGYDTIWQDSEPGCTLCKSGWVLTKELEHTGVPPFSTHPNCSCRVHIKQ
jgi:hypothetical protein